jgi:DNA-directed RNA polymerase subunit F
MEDKLKHREEHYQDRLKRTEERFEKIIALREKQLNELFEEISELRKMNKMWELASKVILGK